jgi:type IVB pilus formation R64 PilN family outer membrane protein
VKSSLKSLTALLALSTALSGCALGGKVRTTVRTNATAAASAMDETPMEAEGAPVVRRTNDMYFGAESFRKRRGDELPPKASHVLVRSAGEVDIYGFASLATRATGIPISANVEKSKTPTVAPNNSNSAAAAIMSMSGRPTMPIQWDGPLAGLLDMVAAKYGVDWEYRDGVVQMTDERTETFVLNALPTTGTVDAAMATTNSGSDGASGGTSGSSGSGVGQAASGEAKLDAGQKASLDVWKDVAATVQVIVGERGRFAITPSNGTITVTAPPSVISQVAQYVRTQNEILTRQVFVRVKVYSIDLANGEDTSLNLTAMFKSAAEKYGLSWASPGTALTSNAGTFTASVIGANSKWNGSEAVARALANDQRSSLISELTLTALNNRPVTKQDIRTQAYVERTSVNVQERSTTTEISPAKLSTGFTVSVLPRIIGGNQILMAYALNLSSLVGIERADAGDVFVQLPTVDSSGSMQESLLSSGQTLILQGYLSDKAVDRREGTGHPDNFLLGGTRQSSTAKRRVVITMEPVIVSNTADR